LPELYLTADGKKVFEDRSATITVPIGGANQPVTIRFEGLSRILSVLSIYLSLDPVIQATPCNPQIGTTPEDMNVVGLTVVCAAGTTLIVDARVVGI